MAATISAKDVMALREKTGLGMMDCKKALEKTGGDMQAAEEWLREQRKGKMDTRTERATAEGRVEIAVRGDQAAIVEVRTETDFTARNEEFEAMVKDVANFALKQPAGAVDATDEITKRVDDLRITTGENVNFARGEKLEGGTFGAYVHHDAKRAALIQVEGKADEELLRNVCQHIVAHVPPPVAVGQDDVPQETIDRIREEAIADAKQAGKPEEIAQKIAEGRVRKHLEEVTLLDQKYIRDETKSIRDVLPKDVTVKRFLRYTLGGE